MASWQSKLMKFVFQNRHLMKGRLTRDTWDFNTSITKFREEVEAGAAKAKMPVTAEAVPVKIDGLPAGLAAEWIQPTAAAPAARVDDAVIFYTHGGGYISGSCNDHRTFVAKFVAGSGIRALLYEYRLAPEHPFPAAIEDTLVAYRWLLAQISPGTRIIIAGESAGGGLCLATLLALRDQGLPMPVCAIAISPMTDLKLTGESHVTRAHAMIDPPGMAEVASALYIGKNDPCNPLISPLYGDLRGLPPLILFAGNDEGFRDDAVRFAEKARATGVDVKLTVAEGQIHCYPLLPDFIPESKRAMDDIFAFMRQHLN